MAKVILLDFRSPDILDWDLSEPCITIQVTARYLGDAADEAQKEVLEKLRVFVRENFNHETS